MTQTILVTGGAGYIGSVCVKSLLDQGKEVIVLDNLSKGIQELVDQRAVFYQKDTTDDLTEIFVNHNIDAIIHFAAYKSVGESMTNPTKYTANIRGLLNILQCMSEYKIQKIIFSSTAAVYGEPTDAILTEESELKPINYYGYTKLACEQNLAWFHRLHGIQYIALRYFNVAGDGGLNYIDPDAQNVLPILMECITGKRTEFQIFGNDYTTRDGTCIRDYIDVRDLVRTHLLALETDYCGVLNLGTSTGVSVKELLDYTEEIIQRPLNHRIAERRPGDPAILVCDNHKASEVLHWAPEYDICDMIRSTLQAYSSDD